LRQHGFRLGISTVRVLIFAFCSASCGKTLVGQKALAHLLLQPEQQQNFDGILPQRDHALRRFGEGLLIATVFNRQGRLLPEQN
jgi:hypothetical protein